MLVCTTTAFVGFALSQLVPSVSSQESAPDIWTGMAIQATAKLFHPVDE